MKWSYNVFDKKKKKKNRTSQLALLHLEDILAVKQHFQKCEFSSMCKKLNSSSQLVIISLDHNFLEFFF